MGSESARKRTRVYEALDENHLVEVAKEDGTTIESFEELEPKQPSERQLAYAESLGIADIPKGLSYHEVSNLISDRIKRNLIDGARKAGLPVPDEITYEEAVDLEELIWSYSDSDGVTKWGHLRLPTSGEVAVATVLGRSLTRYTSSASLYSKIWNSLYSVQDKTLIATWYVFNVFLDIKGTDWDGTPHPMDASFKQLASEFLKNDRACKSLERITPYLSFRESAGHWNDSAPASRRTIAYTVAANLVQREFLIRRAPSTLTSPKKARTVPVTEENSGCAGAVAILFIIPLSAAAGLIYVAATHL